MLIPTLAKKFLFSTDKKGYHTSVVLIASIGIFFATCAVLIGLGVLSGYQKVYREAVLNFSAHLIIFNEEGLIGDEQEQIENFLNKTSIKNHYSPYHFFEALAPGIKGYQPIIFKGIDPNKMKQVYPIQFQNLPHKASNEVFVGKDILTLQKQIQDGGELKYLIYKDKSGQVHTQYGKIAVQGSFSSGYYDFDSKFVLMPLSLLQQKFLAEPKVSGIEIRLEDVNQLELLKSEFLKEFDKQFQVMTWQELNESLFEALKLDRTVVFSVSILILLIACLNIFGFNFLFFIERKREFMILSALGLGLKRLRRLLSLLSLMLGGLAALLGAAFGLIVLKLLSSGQGIRLDPVVYYVDRLPAEFNLNWFLAFIVGAFVLSYLTSLIAGRAVLRRYITANL